MLNPEFVDFYRSWRKKADDYEGSEIQVAFNRFFTLYVAYNRLYVELTLEMARAGKINLEDHNHFPDANAAKHYVRERIGCKKLMSALDSNNESSEAIQAATALLAGPVNGTQFHINLDMVGGAWRPDKDAEHLALFQSKNVNDRAEAILKFIYAVRCNLFHGHKSFEGVQLEVLTPASVLLRHVIDLLFERLNRL